jgi:type IV secretion system protein VirB4
MLNLGEYRRQSSLLADHLPWAALIAPGIVLNKDGSFQRTLRFRGPDLDSATEAELVGICARANNVLRRLGAGWALFFEAERLKAQHYPRSTFPDPASWLVDEERRAAFEDAKQGRHFESLYHLTFLHMPAPDGQAQAESALLETGRKGQGRNWRQELAGFVGETDRVLDLLSGFMPEVRSLDDGETLTYLHGTISTKRLRSWCRRRRSIWTACWSIRR